MKTSEEKRNRTIRLLAQEPAQELQSQPLASLDDLVQLGIAERTKFDEFHNWRLWPSYRTTLTAKGREMAAALSPAPSEPAGQCDHGTYSFAEHGRYCPCGELMSDCGD